MSRNHRLSQEKHSVTSYFPDTIFWYHRISEDIQQERGMYGMIIVEQKLQQKHLAKFR